MLAMQRSRNNAICLLLLLPLLSMCTGAMAATFTLRANQRTAGGSSVAGDAAAVTVLYEGAPVTTRTGQLDESGAAVFRNIPTGPDMTARAEVRHQNLAFHGRPVDLRGGQNAFEVTVDVFDVTTDRSGLSVGVHHLLIEPTPEALRISEYMELRNDTDKAIASEDKGPGGRTRVVRIALPTGFRDLRMVEYFEPEAVVVTHEGFYDTMAVPPGSYQTVFTYSLPVHSETMRITRDFALPTAEFVVFSRIDAGRIEGLGPAVGTVRLQDGRPAAYFNSLSPAPGDRLAFSVTGLQPPGPGGIPFIIVAVVIGTLAVVAILIRRSCLRRTG